MGLFDKLTGKKQDNVELANQAFNTFGVGGAIDEAYRKPVEKFLNQFDTRIDKLKGIAELCGDDKSSKALYIKSMAYFWAGASCRQEAIQTALEYLKNPTWTGLPDDIIETDGIKIRRYDGLMGSFYNYLAKAYEGEQQFDKALEAYQKQRSLEPHLYGIELNIADIYRKMNDLDTAIAILEEARKNPMLKPRKYKTVYDGGFTTENTTRDDTKMFDAALEDLKRKKEKGYKYKPRAKK